MFLSKIEYDRRNWEVIRDLEDRDRLHKKTMRPFPDYEVENPRKSYGVLYRVEQKFLILQSKVPPAGKPMGLGYEILETKDVAGNYDSVKKGNVYRFRLDANTSMRVPREEDEEWVPEDEGNTATKTLIRYRRVGLKVFEERQEWFERRGERHGFTPLDFHMQALPVLTVKTDGALEVTRFEGRLRVEHLESFLHGLCAGIGHGKPYGLGLLSIRNG